MISKYEKTNGVKLFALVAVLAMVFAGAAVMMDDGVDAAEGTTNLSGEITSTQNFGVGTNVVVNGELTIPEGMALIISGGKLTVNAGASIEIQAGGQLIIQKSGSTEPTVIINGNITASGAKPDNYDDGEGYAKPYIGAIVNKAKAADTTNNTGVYVSGSITLERGAQLIADTGETPEITYGTESRNQNKVTIDSTTTAGYITLNDGASISVTKRSSGVSGIADQTVYMSQGSTFSTNGHINNVTVAATANTTYYTAGAVSINTKTENTYQNKAADAQSATDIRETSNLTFTVTSENTPALIQTAATPSYQQITLRQFIVNVEGTVDAGDVLSFDAGKSYYTGKTYTSTWGNNYYVDTDDNVADETKKIVPMTSVTGNLVVTDYKGNDGNNDFNSGVVINGYVSVSGTITAQYSAGSNTSGTGSTAASIKFTANQGITYVTGSISMNAASISAATVKQGSIIVDGGNITIAGADVEKLALMGFYVSASMYTVPSTTVGDTTYLCDFDAAVAGAAEANVSEVSVFASGYYPLGYTDCYNPADAEAAVENGATVVDADLAIPADMEITIVHGFVVAEGATLTLNEGVTITLGTKVNSTSIAGIVFVEGKIVDNDEVMAGYDGADNFVYEVKKTAETETSVIATYTTLKIALGEAQPGEEIQINGQIVIEENLTIPADVTVVTAADDSGTSAVELKGATLTVNGVLEVADNATIKLTTNKTVESSVVINNIVKNATANTTFTDGSNEINVPGAYFAGQIGEDDEGTNYVTSVAVAGANSATATNGITIYGAVNMGDVTFTQGENNELTVTISNKGVNKTTPAETEIATAGTVTLVGADFDLQGAFTGTVQSETSAGMTAVTFNKGDDAKITFKENNDGTTTTTSMVLGVTTSPTTANTVLGTVTIAQGTVYIDGTVTIPMVTVASGATLEVGTAGSLTTGVNPDYKWVANPSLPIDTQGEIKSCAGLVVAGTANIAGTVDADVAYISGTLNLTEDAKNCVIGGLVDGTLAAAEGAKATIGVLLVNGTVTGIYVVTPVPAQNPEDEVLGTIIVAYPGSDVTGAIFNDNGNGESDMNVTAFYINGAAVGTLYTNNEAISVQYILAFVDVPGVIYDSEDGKKDPKYYSDEAMLNEIKTPANAYIGENYPAVYIEMQPSTVTGKISAVQGMTIYIDGLGLKNFESKTGDGYDLTVGDHYITVQVTPGYSATPVITFNGQTVTDGKITITGEMKEFTLLASGDVSVDTGATGGDGMGLTEILLIILVVLIVVMAIMVALRLMRS